MLFSLSNRKGLPFKTSLPKEHIYSLYKDILNKLFFI